MESLSSTLYQSHPWEQWGMSSRDNIVIQLLWGAMVWGPQTCWSPDCPQISLGSLHSFSPVLSFIISQTPWRDAWTQFSHSLTHVCSWEHSGPAALFYAHFPLICVTCQGLLILPCSPVVFHAVTDSPLPSSLHNSSSFFCFPPCSFLRTLYISYLGVIYSLEVS